MEETYKDLRLYCRRQDAGVFKDLGLEDFEHAGNTPFVEMGQQEPWDFDFNAIPKDIPYFGFHRGIDQEDSSDSEGFACDGEGNFERIPMGCTDSIRYLVCLDRNLQVDPSHVKEIHQYLICKARAARAIGVVLPEDERTADINLTSNNNNKRK